MSRMVQRGKMGLKKNWLPRPHAQYGKRTWLQRKRPPRRRIQEGFDYDSCHQASHAAMPSSRPPIRPASLQFCLPLSILLTTRVNLTADTCMKRHSDVTGAECPRVCRWAREMWVPDWLHQKRLEGATSGFLYKLSLMCLWEDWTLTGFSHIALVIAADALIVWTPSAQWTCKHQRLL